MRAETALSAALRNAGVDTDATLLRSIAEAELRRTDVNVFAALTKFTDEVRDAGGIMTKLIPYAVTRDHARQYLETVAADMRGLSVVPAKAGDGVLCAGESRMNVGPVERREGEPVRGSNGRQGEHGLSPSPSNTNGAVLRANESRRQAGGVVRIPNPPRGLAALETHARVNSAFDSYLTRQGPIGDLVWSSLPRLAAQNAREAALLKMIYEHSSPTLTPNARVRDVIKLEDLQRMIQKSAEIAGD